SDFGCGHHGLEVVDVDFFDVFNAGRPEATLDCLNTADDLGKALKDQADARERDDHLEGINGRSICSDVGVFANGKRLARIDVAGPHQCNDTGEIEKKVQQ